MVSKTFFSFNDMIGTSCRAFLFILSCLSVSAQAQNVQFRHLDVENGLSNNQINTILKDSKGFIWFGTSSGLNRYDGHTFKIFKHTANQETSLLDNTINELYLGPDEQLWVKTGLGFNVYNHRNEQFIRNTDSLLITMKIPPGQLLHVYTEPNGTAWLLHTNGALYRRRSDTATTLSYKSNHTSPVSSMAAGPNGTVWLVYQDGLIESIDKETLTPKTSRKIPFPKTSVQPEYRVFCDDRENIWIYARNLPVGIFRWRPNDNSVVHFNSKSASGRLSNDLVRSIAQDSRGYIWLATDHGGLNIFDPATGEVRYVVHDEHDSRSLSQNSTISLLADPTGMIWIGTYKRGVNYYHPETELIPHFQHSRSNPNSLPYDDVNCFVEDEKKNLWIGTNGGGLLYYDRQNNRYTQYLQQENDPQSIGSNIIVSLLLDKSGILWIGTYHGGLNRFDGKIFTRYTHKPGDNSSIADNSVWELLEDSKGRFWVGTLSAGLSTFDKKSGKFTHIGFGRQGESPSSSYIAALNEDSKGNIWIGTATGLDVLDAQGNYKRYVHTSSATYTLSHDYIADILEDKKGRIWVATRDGLNLYLPEKDGFAVFREENGLADNSPLTISEDLKGNIWVSTPKGISVLHPDGNDFSKWKFISFDRHDGLQPAGFNENAALLTQAGDIVFGGPTGFNIIPSVFRTNKPTQFSEPIVTEFHLFNKPLGIGEKAGKKVILQEAVSLTSEVTLPHNQNVFSLVLSALQYDKKDKIRFQYQLEGFNNAWLPLDDERKATFTNLDPGRYLFNVRLSTDNQTWTHPYSLLKITIQPPFWKTGWAYLFYFTVFIGSLWLLRRIEKLRELTRFRLQQERERAERAHAVDRIKTRFFTNMSHEFRTPISLVLAPLDKLIENNSDPLQKKQLIMIQRNTKRLLNLVNQLLEFRKIDTQTLRLNLQPGNIAEAIRLHAESFVDLAELKQIRFEIFPPSEILASFDHDKIERIVFNLLSNAFKFTPVGGTVSISLTEIPENSQIRIVVADNGMGVPEADQARIFERFFQHETPTSVLNQGSGIGLTITREYTNLMGGTISLVSSPGKGAQFSVILPSTPAEKTSQHPPKSALLRQEESPNSVRTNTPTAQWNTTDQSPLSTRYKILLVEDNDDFRFYLEDNLREFFITQTAKNASEGWEKTLSSHPDLIITDVQMPETDGIEFCERLKSDTRTRHIPVILLTAVTDEASQLKGFSAGAADYVTKPFNVALLFTKINNLLKQKTVLEKTYRKQFTVEPSVVSNEAPDEKFMRRVMSIIEDRIDDSELSVEELAEKAGISRVGLYKRILSLSGFTPSEFIRNIRLKKAAQLLNNSGKTVAEIAYETGFGTPKAFSKHFRSLYGVSPSHYRKEQDATE